MAQPIKPFSSAPREFSSEWADQVQSAINQLIGQGQNPTQQKGFPSLQVPVVDPTTPQITSKGNRMSSVTTPITWVATSSSISFFWDGTNGSQFLRIGRDDGTIVGPTNNGSPVVVSNLSPSTQYYFYPYWDESAQKVIFATVPQVSVGTPAIAFAVPNFLAAQQQILRTHIQLAVLLAQTGVATPGSGSTSGTGGSGGGGAGGGSNRGNLQ